MIVVYKQAVSSIHYSLLVLASRGLNWTLIFELMSEVRSIHRFALKLSIYMQGSAVLPPCAQISCTAARFRPNANNRRPPFEWHMVTANENVGLSSAEANGAAPIY